MMKTGRIIMWNTMPIRHMPVMVKQYLREQIAKSRTQTLVTFWSTKPTNHDISYNPSKAHAHMYINCDTGMRLNCSNQQNQINKNNSSDGNHSSRDTEQDNVGINNVNILRVEHNE